MRLKLKHLPIRNIVRRLKLHCTDAKCGGEGRQTDNSIPQLLAGVPKTAGVESEFERAPLSTPHHDTGPTTIPSTTITTSYEHLGIYSPGNPAASSQISLPAITIVDPDENSKTASTSIQELSASESLLTYPNVFGRDDSELLSERLYAPDLTQGAVNSALPKALQSNDFVSGLVNQIMAALVPVLDERIKVALDSRASKTESNSLRMSEKLGPILEEPEQLSPLDILLDRKPRISNTKLQSVKEPTPDSPTRLSGGDPLTRTAARRGTPREKPGRHLDPLKAPFSPPKTPAKYPGNLPTPESHCGNWAHLPAGGHVNTQAFFTPTRGTSSGKLPAEHAVELVITVSSTAGPRTSDSLRMGRSLLWATEARASAQGEPGPAGAAIGTQDVFTAVQKLPVSVLPSVRSKLTEVVIKVPTFDDQPFAGPSMPQLSAPRLADATLRPTSSPKLGHSPPHPSDHGATRSSMGSLVDNSLLRDPAIVCVGSRLIGGYPLPSGDETGDRKAPTKYVKAPPDGEREFSDAVPARTDPAPIPPLDEHQVDPLPAPRTLLDGKTHSLEWIGGGASGEVYRVTDDRAPHARFALKFVPLYLSTTREAAVLEARALLKIKSANMYSEGARHVLRMFQDSAPEASDTCHAVIKMPYYKNTLHDYMHMLDRASLLFVTAEVPSNIIIDNEGHCVIGDFSGSYMGSLPKLAKKQISTMTPEFMAPEMSTGHSYRPSAKFDERADIWCLGVTIYMLICGQRAVKVLRDDRPDFTDYDNIGLGKDTMLRLMNLASCSETVQKLVLEMCQIDQNLRWNTTMIQWYLEERNCWKWDDLSPLRKYSVYPVSSRPDLLGRGLVAPEDISPEILRACCDTYLKEIYAL